MGWSKKKKDQGALKNKQQDNDDDEEMQFDRNLKKQHLNQFLSACGALQEKIDLLAEEEKETHPARSTRKFL